MSCRGARVNLGIFNTGIFNTGIFTTGLLLALVLWVPRAADAQYFGRNVVQYRTFDFQVLKTEHFDIYFYPEEREGVDMAARMAERWLVRLERMFDHELRGRQPLVLYASQPDFQQTNVVSGIGEGTGGVTESLKRRIVLPLAGPLQATDHVIGHELVHAFQFDMTSEGVTAVGVTGAHYLPLWFIEGMAEYLSIGAVDPNTTMWLRDAARRETLPSIEDLDDPEYFPYRWGQAFWAFVTGRYGEGVIADMLRVGGAAQDYHVAIERVLGVTVEELTAEWHTAIRRDIGPVLANTTPPGDIGKRLLATQSGLGGNLNIGPSISPDGKLVAFLSERSLFSIDLFIADATTGEVLRKLTSAATDPHLSSLQFIYSSGAWDSTSRRLAIATISDGHPALAIYDARSGRREREIEIKDLSEIFNPTWSPDDRSVAFTGMKGGLTDLFVMDLSTGDVRQLTRDPYADVQPAWSPDGRRIAFATDRFSSKLDVLSIGELRLALIDPASGRIEPVGPFTSGKNINPQWAPDSASIYFLSDRDGITNLYRVRLGGTINQLTTISTGITGITAQSPALSVARTTGLAAFSVYDGGAHNVHTLELNPLPGDPLAPLPDGIAVASVLPPLTREPSRVKELLESPEEGLPPEDAEPETEEYKGGLRLEAIGPPSIAVGASSYGAAISGGIALYFADLLGNQNLITAFQFNAGISGSTSINDSSIQVQYLNRTHRWNWGIAGGQVPYLSGAYVPFIVDTGDDVLLFDRTIVNRQTERHISGVSAYPLNRSQRLELQAGVSRITFERIIRTDVYSLVTGNQISEDTETIDLADPLSLGTTSAALVYDTSTFGATSPVQGSRYRLEAAPTFGGIQFTSILADYRRYFMPAPFYTLAGRVMHYGRYGSGAEDGRLSPLYLGYPSLVRGYDVYTFDASECLGDFQTSCPAVDNLSGSRILVGNLEFRFPLLRPFGVTRSMYGPIPVEVALFADAGVAWDSDSTPEWFGGRREAISSVGWSFRTNLGGVIVAEFAFSKPLQRNTGLVFQFNFAPGF